MPAPGVNASQIPLKLYVNDEDASSVVMDELCRVLPTVVVIPNSVELSV